MRKAFVIVCGGLVVACGSPNTGPPPVDASGVVADQSGVVNDLTGVVTDQSGVVNDLSVVVSDLSSSDGAPAKVDGGVSAMSFFITSTGSGSMGGNLGGLSGADAKCLAPAPSTHAIASARAPGTTAPAS